MPSRLRAIRVAAAAPNSRIIGGAGTWVPPVELDEPPLEDDELEVERRLVGEVAKDLVNVPVAEIEKILQEQ